MGKRRRQPHIMESIERDIAIQVSMKDVEKIFADGKPHEITFFDGIFLDGQSLDTPIHRPMVFHKECASFEEFGEAFTGFTDGLTKTYKEVLYRDMAAIRACAKAGIALIFGMYTKAETSSEELQKACRVLGTALSAETVKELESVYGFPEELRTLFEEYVAEPWPVIGEAAMADLMEKLKGAEVSQ